jgi:hypothetical protein
MANVRHESFSPDEAGQQPKAARDLALQQFFEKRYRVNGT